MNIHFIAIGGSAMHSLAIVLHEEGKRVSGSDDAIFEPSHSRLKEKGLLPAQLGWFPEKITTYLDAIILGMHAKADNPELKKAQELGLPIYSYPEYLYERAKDKTRVVVAGSHGKTTITAMILHVMRYHGRKVDYMIGAQLEGYAHTVHLSSKNEFMVLEGDEYLTSALDKSPKFIHYHPNIALISGIAWDHINVFPTEEAYLLQFEKLIQAVTDGGILVYNAEDPKVQKLVDKIEKPIRKHPYNTPEYRYSNGVAVLETEEGPLPLQIFGVHNLSNLAGAKWICQHMGVDEADFYEAISSFKGASKRLETIITGPKGTLFKDFAHAPSKVQGSTKAVREIYPEKVVYAFLELHTYSSLNPTFLKQYRNTLDAADVAVVFFSAEALEVKGLPPLDPALIRHAFGREDLLVFESAKDFRDYLESLPSEGDIFLFMSSGNYGGIDWELLKKKFSVLAP